MRRLLFRKRAKNVQERDRAGQAENARQRAGGFTAIDELRAERVCADSVKVVRRQRSGNAQSTKIIAKLNRAVSVCT